MGNNKLKLVIQLAVLGGCWSVVYLVPYLQYTWYDPFQEFLGATNTQLGFLITVYGLGNIFGAPVGGWLADRINYKVLYVLSVALNAVFSILFIMHPTYSFAMLCWIGFAVASLFLNYPTHVKIVRDLATEENQGKIFGFNETSIGLFNIIISSAMMFAFSHAVSNQAGIVAAVICNAGISVVLTILAIFVLKGPEKKEKKEAEETKKPAANSNFFKNFVTIAKMPGTWLVGITIMAVYSFMNTLTYFTPYFTDVLGATVAFTGWMAILRQYGTQFIGAPVGGIMSDRIGSPSKTIMVTYAVGLVGLIYMIVPKQSVSMGFVIGLILVLSFFVYTARGAYYATIEETGIPRELTASAIGVAAAVGFSPDLFQFVLFGWYLDKFGNTGYTYIFVTQAVILVIGVLAAIAILKLKKKHVTGNSAA